MKILKILIIIMAVFIFMERTALAESEGTASSSSGSDVSVQCKGCEKNRTPMGAGGGRSTNPDDSMIAQQAKNNKAQEDNTAKIADKTKEGLNQNTQVASDNLTDCITKIDASIFTGNFSKILDSIIDSIKNIDFCKISKKISEKVVADAISRLTFDLPMGLGTIGANSNVGVGGIQILSTSSAPGTGKFSFNQTAEQNATAYEIYRKSGTLVPGGNGGLGDLGDIGSLIK